MSCQSQQESNLKHLLVFLGFGSAFYFSSVSFAVLWHYLLSVASRMSGVCLRVPKTAGSANGVASGTTILALIWTIASHRSQDWGEIGNWSWSRRSNMPIFQVAWSCFSCGSIIFTCDLRLPLKGKYAKGTFSCVCHSYKDSYDRNSSFCLKGDERWNCRLRTWR